MRRRRAARVLLVIFTLVWLGSVVVQYLGLGAPSYAALVVAMPLLITIVLLRTDRPRRRLVIITLVALVFSWFGDAVGFTLLIKIGFFLVAQIAYCVVAFWPYRRSSVLARPVWLIAYGGGVLVIVAAVAAGAGGLRIPVFVYGVSLGVMAVLSTGLGVRGGIGGLLFLISDIVLAVDAFVQRGLIPSAGAVNMLFYLSGQALLVLAVLDRTQVDNRSAGRASL